MEKIILVKYGEIFLKGKNRSFFEKMLQENIKNSLSNLNCEVLKIPGRFIVSKYEEKNEQKVISLLLKQAGIFSVSPAVLIETNLGVMKKTAVSLMEDEVGTFKVVSNRADKTFEINSMEVSRLLGGEILRNNQLLKVDVNKPEHVLNVDIRENNRTRMFLKTYQGIGGLPVGSAGKGLLLLSGGIDSPVAGYMLAKRGVKVSAVHFHSYPYTSNFAREKVEDLAKLLTPYTGDLTIYMVSMTELQEQIHAHCDDAYMITLLRRGMFTIAERLCRKYDRKMIITGENLGQVASQTIESMTVVSEVVKHTPIIRPLVAFDKYEIINIAKKIDTYETSIKPFEDCCTVFLPDNPVVKPVLYKVKKEQSKIDFDAILDRAMESVEIVEIKAD